MTELIVKDVTKAPYSGVVYIKINDGTEAGGVGTGYMIRAGRGAMVVTAAHNILWPSRGVNALANPAQLELYTGVETWDRVNRRPGGPHVKRYTARVCEVPQGYAQNADNPGANVFFDLGLIAIAEPVSVDGGYFDIDRAELVFEGAPRTMQLVGFNGTASSLEERCKMRIAKIESNGQSFERTVAGYSAPGTSVGPGWSGGPIFHYWPPNQPQLSGAPSVGVHIKDWAGGPVPFLGTRFHPENIAWVKDAILGIRTLGAPAARRVIGAPRPSVRILSVEKEELASLSAAGKEVRKELAAFRSDEETAEPWDSGFEATDAPEGNAGTEASGTKGGKGSGKGSGKTPKPAASAGATPKTAIAAKKGETVEGELAAASACYYALALKSGQTNKFTVYARLTDDSHSVTGSFAVQDEEGGVLFARTFLIDATGEDFTREVYEFDADETATHLFRIRSDDKDAIRVAYKIKIG